MNAQPKETPTAQGANQIDVSNNINIPTHILSDQQNQTKTEAIPNNNSSKFWNICTHNSQELHDLTKHNLFFTYCKKQQFDFIAIQETWFTFEPKHPIFDPESFFEIWAVDTQQQKGNGTGLLIHTQWRKHIFKIYKHEGRGIAIDLIFKGKNHFKIICIYTP